MILTQLRDLKVSVNSIPYIPHFDVVKKKNAMNNEELPKPLKCPECDKAVLNRRYPKCEFCGSDLPNEFRLSKEELKASKHALKIAKGYKNKLESSDDYATDSGGYYFNSGSYDFGGDGGCDGGD